MKKSLIIAGITLALVGGVSLYLRMHQAQGRLDEKSEMTMEEARNQASAYMREHYPEMNVEEAFRSSDEYEYNGYRYYAFTYVEERGLIDQVYILEIDRDTGELILSLSD